MSPLEEPTLGEIIRDLQGNLGRLSDNLNQLVTRAEFEAHAKDAEKRLSALEGRAQRMAQFAISGFVGPLLVIIVAYALGMRP